METTRAERIRLGIFLFLGISLILGTVAFYLGKKLMEERTPYYTRFSESVDGLHPGAKVKWNGVAVGQVVRIRIDEKNLEDIIVDYDVQLGTPIKGSMRANLVGGISITGLKNIELTGGTPEEPMLAAGSEIVAGTSQFKQITGQAETIIIKTETLMNNLLAITGDANQANLASSLRHLSSLAAHMDTLIVRNRGNVDSISRDLRSAIHHMETASLSAKQSMDIFNKEMQGLDINARLDLITKDVQKAILGFEKSSTALTQKIQEIEIEKTVKGVNDATKGIETASKRADLMLYRAQEDFSVSLKRLKEASENMADFSRQIKENPSLLLRSEEKQGRQR